MIRTSDWLRHSPECRTVVNDNHESQLGALAVLAAGLEGGDSLAQPLVCPTELSAGLQLLPPQFGGLKDDSPLGQWMNFAALAELLQAPQLADLFLKELIARLVPHTGGHLHGYGEIERAEVAAMCWARRGRLARIQGRLDDAEAFYDEAIGGAGGRWRDAYPAALIGRAALAVNRGNFPAAERIALRLLARRPKVFALYRVSAHQLMTFTLRRRGQLIEALRHGWRAFDLLSADDMRRDELVVTMSEIALACGDCASAVRGFSSVRLDMLPTRVRVPALAGLLEATVRSMPLEGRPPVEAARASLSALLDASLAPGDTLLALIALSETALALNERDHAADWIARAQQIADQHGFHEKRFHVDALRQQLDVKPAQQAPAVPVIAVGTAVGWPMVRRRFAALSASSAEASV